MLLVLEISSMSLTTQSMWRRLSVSVKHPVSRTTSILFQNQKCFYCQAGLELARNLLWFNWCFKGQQNKEGINEIWHFVDVALSNKLILINDHLGRCLEQQVSPTVNTSIYECKLWTVLSLKADLFSQNPSAHWRSFCIKEKK